MRKYRGDRSKKAIAFLNELAEVCKRHGLSLGHEDSHGGFEVLTWNEHCDKWLRAAAEEEEEPKPEKSDPVWPKLANEDWLKGCIK